MTKTQQMLDRCFLFSSLTESEKRGLWKELDIRSFAGGAVIYSPEKYEKALGIVLEGEAAVYKEPGTVLNVIAPGECFGAAALFRQQTEEKGYVTTIIAHKDCQAAFISQQQLTGWFAQYPEMAVSYIAFLSDRIRFLNAKIDSFTKVRAMDAVKEYLSRHAGNGSERSVSLPKGAAGMARELSISRATLYRCLDELTRDGLIDKQKNTILLKGEWT